MTFLRKLLDWWQRDRLARELEEELRFHQAKLEEDSPGATGSARRRMGNLTAVAEEARAVWGIRWLDETAQDIRLAMRSLARTPGFSAVAIIALAVGIGVNTAVFSIANWVVLRPVPGVRDPNHLSVAQFMENGRFLSTSQPNFNDLRTQATAFDALAAQSATNNRVPVTVPG